jgi:hypothetical protein
MVIKPSKSGVSEMFQQMYELGRTDEEEVLPAVPAIATGETAQDAQCKRSGDHTGCVVSARL